MLPPICTYTSRTVTSPPRQTMSRTCWTIVRIRGGLRSLRVTESPVIRQRGRRSEEPPRPGTAPPRHNRPGTAADYRRFRQRVEEVAARGAPDDDWAYLRRVGTGGHRSRARVEGRAPRVLVEGARQEERRRPSRARCRHLGRQTQMAQDALNHRGLLDQRDQAETPGTPRTRQGIDAETSTHEISPAWRRRARRSPTAPRWRGRCVGLLGGVLGLPDR